MSGRRRVDASCVVAEFGSVAIFATAPAAAMVDPRRLVRLCILLAFDRGVDPGAPTTFV